MLILALYPNLFNVSLKVKGRIALVMYPHESGQEEAKCMEEFLKTQTSIQVQKIQNLLVDHCPYVLLIEKRR